MKYTLLFFYLFLFTADALLAQFLPANYNLEWNTKSNNASESMPCGGGDIGMNVWVENGDLLVYVARSGSFNEENAMMKAGRIRLRLSPNPFAGKNFRQQLHLDEGHITVQGDYNGIKATIKIWADVFKPVSHIVITAGKNINVVAAYESWRFKYTVIKPRENFGNS